MYNYPAVLTPEDGAVVVTFPDVPEAITYGEDEAEALMHAVDALETALSIYIDKRQDLPAPSPADGRPTVSPSLLAQLKLEVYSAMRARGWRKADLARALRVNPRQIDRLFDLGHSTRVAELEAALSACGERFDVRRMAA